MAIGWPYAGTVRPEPDVRAALVLRQPATGGLTISKLSCTGKATMDILRIIIAIFIPPLGVFLQEGLGKHFWINVILTLLGYVPGIIHALWIIIKR